MSSDLIQCACGCGATIPSFDKKGRPNRFKAGHNSQKSKSTLQRFNEGWVPEPNSGCWLWVKSVNAGGYGYFRREHKTELAHRVAWELFNGPLVEDELVLHKCDTPPCVNPAHLFIGDHKINYEDSRTKGRASEFPSTKGKHWKWK